MVEFPGDNKERWSWASPARTLGSGPEVPGVRRGSRVLSCCAELTWSWCGAGARAGQQRWAKPRRARAPRVSAEGQREGPVRTAGAGAGARGRDVSCARAPVLAASPAPVQGSGPALASSAAVPQPLCAEGGASPRPEVGREQTLAGQEKTIFQCLQSKLRTARQHCAEQGWTGTLSPPASSVGLEQCGSLRLQAVGEPRGPISGSRAAFPEQRDGGRRERRGLVRRAGVPRAGLEGAGGERHPARPGHGAAGEGCPAGDSGRGWGQTGLGTRLAEPTVCYHLLEAGKQSPVSPPQLRGAPRDSSKAPAPPAQPSSGAAPRVQSAQKEIQFQLRPSRELVLQLHYSCPYVTQ